MTKKCIWLIDSKLSEGKIEFRENMKILSKIYIYMTKYHIHIAISFFLVITKKIIFFSKPP